MGIAIEISHEKQGIRAAYVDGAPGIRMGIHNQKSDLMFSPGAALMFDPLTDLMFGTTASTYPGYKLEVVT